MFLFISPPMALLDVFWVSQRVSQYSMSFRKGRLGIRRVFLRAQENLVTQSFEYIRGNFRTESLFACGKQRGSRLCRPLTGKDRWIWSRSGPSVGLLKAFTAVFKITGCGMLFLASILYLSGAIYAALLLDVSYIRFPCVLGILNRWATGPS